MKKIVLIFVSVLLLSNLVFIANFLWSAIFGLGFLDTAENKYNTANQYYLSNDFVKASQYYKQNLEQESDHFAVLHNLWNSYYRIWDLENAISSYQEALGIQEHPETQKNLEFVQSQFTQQPSSQEEKQDDQWQSSEQNESESQWEQTDTSQATWEQQSAQNGELSEQTQDILEQRAQELEQAQEQLQNYYQQDYKQNNTNSLIDQLFNNSLLNQGDQKDW